MTRPLSEILKEARDALADVDQAHREYDEAEQRRGSKVRDFEIHEDAVLSFAERAEDLLDALVRHPDLARLAGGPQTASIT